MKKLSLEDFIRKSRIVHGDKYDYSKSVYKGSLQKIKIICPTHGTFEQIANNHLQGMNCPNCANTDKVNPKKSLDSFLKKAKTIHGDKYDYSESVYKGAQKKIKIICPVHGVFEQIANNHLQGHGCRLCGDENKNKNKNKKQKLEEFIEKAKKIHGDKYDYSESIYNGTANKIKIRCLIHGIFEVRANLHMQGFGCQTCSKEKRAKKKPNV